MELKAAKELVHIRSWLGRVDQITRRGKRSYSTIANRNFIIHQYDEINRELTWLTLSTDLPAWKVSLQALFDDAAGALDAGD